MFNFLLKNALVPKSLYRLAIYIQITNRLMREKKIFNLTSGETKIDLINILKASDIALSTASANIQHYELPTDFYRTILGPNLKYSCCYYPKKHMTLEQAEVQMLDLYCQRLDIKNGQHLLDLGCGWGSFTLYAAKKFPNCTITAISNSTTQKIFIDQMCQLHNYQNVTTITQDINNLELTQQFDRIISIEMFEHVRNYKVLLNNICNWLNPQGKLFVHHFCHQYLVYPFNSDDSWMAKHFFQNGLMPSEDLLMFFQDDVTTINRWRINGKHYKKTCYHWLDNLYENKSQILKIFANHYEQPKLYYQYWDLFIRACAQLFSYNSGNEWFVAHYLFQKK